ncbi:MAG: histidinol phosphate phosphatase domain-containing protein [Armatimonadota bacterium]
MLYDFHMHTTLSDGVLSPAELIRRAITNGYTAMGIADHSGAGQLARIIEEVSLEKRLVKEHWDFDVLVGVELTHVPPTAIAELAAEAKSLGADHVVIHGETPVEPVPEGTNLAACRCADVDILAHPGALTEEAARAAAENDIFVEISARQGHCLGNGHVARVALAAGAGLIVNSDAHAPGDLLTEEFAHTVASGAGLDNDQVRRATVTNPQKLLLRAGVKP